MWSFVCTTEPARRDLYEEDHRLAGRRQHLLYPGHSAATVDGANALHRFKSITIPFCSPVILFTLVTGFIYGFQDFTMPWLLTGGGPNEATEFYALHLFRNAFRFLRMGKASAMAWVLFLIVVAFTFILFRSSSRLVYYADSSE